ncbi:MAG: hypothetical protein SF339_26670 [Blastocatellia bacterium]|nr:hypothetical protein [Blastocatellia bacterium]
MRKRRIVIGLLLAAMMLIVGSAAAQESRAPFTREEILRVLKTLPGARSEQGDLAGEIEQRGVSFPVDETVLEELRKAGARAFVIEAIKRSAARMNEPRPTLQRPGANPAPAAAAEPERPRDIRDIEDPAARAAALARLPLLDQARFHAEEFVDELPNFVVTQFVTRSIQTPEKKGWQEQDKLQIELTYSAKKGEQFKLVRLNGKPTTMSYDSLGGATSTGEFGSMLAALFAPDSRAEFKELKREAIRGRQTVVYDFRVKKAFSSNRITDKTSRRSVITGYAGSVWIEADSGRVVRIEQSADDIQRGFPITLAESAVEYDWVTIAGARYLLPVYAEVILGQDSDRFYSRNVIELRDYKVFDTDLKILPEKDPPQ